MSRFVLKNHKIFCENIFAISELVNELTLKVNNDGFESVCFDPANVAMINFSFSKENFTEYENVGENFFCFDVIDLKKVLKRVRADDVLVLEFTDDKLKIVLKSDVTRRFSLALIDNEEVKKVPELTFNVNGVIKSNVLVNSVNDVNVLGSDSVRFCVSPEIFSIKGGDGLGSVLVEIKNDFLTNVDEGNVESVYSVDYLQKILLASRFCDKVGLSFGKDYPLMLVFEGEGVILRFVLAPRVEE